MSSARLEKLNEQVRITLQKQFGVNPDKTIKLDKIGGDFVVWGMARSVRLGGTSSPRNAQALGIHDVQRSVKPYRPGDREANDMDVAFMDDQMALVMVECKSGEQQHGKRDGYFLQSEFGGGVSHKRFKAKAILATTSNFLLDPATTWRTQGTRQGVERSVQAETRPSR